MNFKSRSHGPKTSAITQSNTLCLCSMEYRRPYSTNACVSRNIYSVWNFNGRSSATGVVTFVYFVSYFVGGRLWTHLCSMMCKNYAEWWVGFYFQFFFNERRLEMLTYLQKLVWFTLQPPQANVNPRGIVSSLFATITFSVTVAGQHGKQNEGHMCWWNHS